MTLTGTQEELVLKCDCPWCDEPLAEHSPEEWSACSLGILHAIRLGP